MAIASQQSYLYTCNTHINTNSVYFAERRRKRKIRKVGEKEEKKRKMIKSKYPELNDREWLNQKYVVEKLSATKIGEILNCSHHSVTRSLRRLGMPVRTRT